MPRLPDPDFDKLGHGVSLLSGWLPTTIQIVTVVVVVVVAAALGWRSRRWRVPVAAAVGIAVALVARAWMNSEGLASNPAPLQLWVWTGLSAAVVVVAGLGWAGASWRRRVVSLMAIPLALVSTLVVLNEWVGYYSSVQRAWGDLTSGPLPDQISAGDVAGLRNTHPVTGKVLVVDTPDSISGFKHRSEYVYLPPAWFAGPTPPQLPVVMMIGGEFGNPSNWIRTGNAVATIDDFARVHGGAAPVFVFPDSSGSFNNDTECVNGPRGNAADHLTKEVRPYIISRFGTSDVGSRWAVAGWSAGGTCAINLAVMHPDLFATFVDIGGDRGPNSGDKQQTIDRLYAGSAAMWDSFDTRTVMTKHGPYVGVAGLFNDSQEPPDDKTKNLPDHRQQRLAPVGFGGHGDEAEYREKGALPDLCAAAVVVNIGCTMRVYVGYHTWQFAAQAFRDSLPWIVGRVGS